MKFPTKKKIFIAILILNWRPTHIAEEARQLFKATRQGISKTCPFAAHFYRYCCDLDQCNPKHLDKRQMEAMRGSYVEMKYVVVEAV